MKKLLLQSIALFGFCILLYSCAVNSTYYQPKHVVGTVKFTPKEDEVFTSQSLEEYMKNATKPSIVLRVPNSSQLIANKNTYASSDVYGTIEKELMTAGFAVRDRALFTDIANKGKTPDYNKLSETTDTDLILEVIESAPYKVQTNKYTYKGREKVADFPIKSYALKIEFKVISIRENTVVGDYVFYYTPCVNGCTNIYYASGLVFPIGYKATTSELMLPPNPYEYRFDKNSVANFYQVSTQRLIKAMKN